MNGLILQNRYISNLITLDMYCFLVTMNIIMLLIIQYMIYMEILSIKMDWLTIAK